MQSSNCRANGDLRANRVGFDRRRLNVTNRVDRLGLPWTFVFPGEAGFGRPLRASGARRDRAGRRAPRTGLTMFVEVFIM
jgi:hypothetical protein